MTTAVPSTALATIQPAFTDAGHRASPSPPAKDAAQLLTPAHGRTAHRPPPDLPVTLYSD